MKERSWIFERWPSGSAALVPSFSATGPTSSQSADDSIAGSKAGGESRPSELVAVFFFEAFDSGDAPSLFA
jgi:hypothetical protein